MGTLTPRLNVVTIGTRDFTAMRRFYEALGWPTTSPPDSDHAQFDLGGAVLALWSMDQLAAEAGARAAEPGTFTVASFDERGGLVWPSAVAN